MLMVALVIAVTVVIISSVFTLEMLALTIAAIAARTVMAAVWAMMVVATIVAMLCNAHG